MIHAITEKLFLFSGRVSIVPQNIHTYMIHAIVEKLFLFSGRLSIVPPNTHTYIAHAISIILNFENIEV